MDTDFSLWGLEGWMVWIFVIVLATLLLRFMLKIVLDRLATKLEETKTPYDDAFLEVVRKPAGWAIWILGILQAAEVAKSQTEATVFDAIGPLREVTIIVLLTWFAVRFTSRATELIGDRKDKEERQSLLAISKLIRIALAITGFLIILQSLGFSIEGVLAFGGIGGIAVGFAARDVLANFFGAFMIFLDKPFSVGDWIRSPDQEIEGTVEDVGWRVTRIRTFDKRPLYIPNSSFANITVENPSRMTNRRIYETIGVRYDDVSVLPQILEDIREMVRTHPEIDTTQTLMVNFNAFNESSVDFFIYTFTKTTEWVRFHEIKEDVLLKISNIVESHGGSMAFPTQTLHVDSLPPDLEQS